MNASYASIIQLCNESSFIHSHLHPSQTQPEHNDRTSCTSCLCACILKSSRSMELFLELLKQYLNLKEAKCNWTEQDGVIWIKWKMKSKGDVHVSQDSGHHEERWI
eukprot:275619_1